MIDVALLETKRAQLMETVLLHQGGIQMIDHLLSLMQEDEKDAMSMEELAQVVGGNGAVMEVVENA